MPELSTYYTFFKEYSIKVFEMAINRDVGHKALLRERNRNSPIKFKTTKKHEKIVIEEDNYQPNQRKEK